MGETNVPDDFQRTDRFELRVALPLNASYSCSWKLEIPFDLTQDTHSESARMTGFLTSRPAQDYRAASNQARWLTEVDRSTKPKGESATTPPTYSEYRK